MACFKRYMQLGRVFSAMLTAGIAMMGAYSTGHVLTAKELLLFVWLGFWYHSFGGAYNEIVDYELDSLVSELRNKPLVSGAVSFTQALAFLLVTVFAGLLAVALFFPHAWVIVLFIASYTAAGYYDAKGKYTPYMFELSLGFTFFFWALFGAVAVSHGNLSALTWNTVAVALTIFVFAVYINWGNAMKDAPTDRRLMVPTRAVAWGYRHEDVLDTASPHILYALFIKSWLLVAFALPILVRLIWGDLPPGVLPAGATLFGVDLYALFYLVFVVPSQLWIVKRATGRHDREWWKNYIVADIFLTWLAFSFMAVMVVGVAWSLVLFIFPLIWFAGTTTMMYGRPMRVGL